MKRTILVIREYDEFSRILAGANLEVINFPTIRTLPVENFAELDAKLSEIESYDGLFFTSPQAAEVFLQRIEQKNYAFGGKVYVLGNRTGRLFADTNFEIVFRENANTAEELINSFEKPEFDGKRFLFVRGDKSLRAIPELLRDVAAAVDEIVVYRTIENSPDKILSGEISDKIRGRQIDWICFFSPSGIESFTNVFGENLPGTIRIAAIGETTAGRAAEKKLKVGFISAKANAVDFARGLLKRIKEIE